MTSLRGKFGCTMTEKNFMIYMDQAGLDSLRRAGIVVKSISPRGSKSNPEGGEILRVGIGFMRLGREEAEADTSQPRLRLVPPGSEKMVRTIAIQHRPEAGAHSFPYWGSCSVLDVGQQGGRAFKPGLFRLMRRIWKQQPVELIFRDGVEPPQAIISMPTKWVPVGVTDIKRVAGTLSAHKGGEKLEELAESLAHPPEAPEPTPAPEVAPPRAAEEAPSAPAPVAEEPEDEAALGLTKVTLLSLGFNVPITETLRIADKWTRAGYAINKEAKM